MESRVPRIGAWAGFIAVAGIVGYHVALTVLAGQRVSGTTDVDAIGAYYGQAAVAILGVSQFLVVVPFLVLAQALRQVGLALLVQGKLPRSEEKREQQRRAGP